MLKFLQINLNQCWTAQQLMVAIVMDRGIDFITIVSEQHSNVRGNRSVDRQQRRGRSVWPRRQLAAPASRAKKDPRRSRRLKRIFISTTEKMLKKKEDDERADQRAGGR